MNLSKLWNSKYLFQNIKKSRTAIALFFIIVPIFTTLMIIASDEEVFDYGFLSVVNVMGLYVIPFIFSASLFGYVFKKNSTDFIGSMPISRKCIFATNTIGGTILILLMQLITLILTLIVSSLTKNALFFGIALDIFIYQTIAYIFVFACANLAMTMSGTLASQIALTLLIVFAVPFSSWYVNVMANGTSGAGAYTLINEGIELVELDKVPNYTAPFLIFTMGNYEFNVLSVGRMVILSAIYFVIGLFLFSKKKLETAGESFENKYIHFIIKGLTLIPFVALFGAIINYEEGILAIIIFAIIVVYYFVFDLITGKKVKLLENIISLIISITVLYGTYSIAIKICENMDRKLSLDSIKEAKFEINHLFYTKTNDKNKIIKTIVALANVNKGYAYDFKSSYIDSAYEYDVNEVHRNYTIQIELIGKCGEKYHDYMYIDKKVISDIFDESFKNAEISNNGIISNYDVSLSKEDRDDIYKEIKESLKDLSVKQIVENDDGVDYLTINLMDYLNHKLIEFSYPVSLNKKIESKLISAYNKNSVNCLRNGAQIYYYTVDSFNKFDDDTMGKIWSIINDGNTKFLSDFILENANDVPEDLTKCIRIRTNRFSFYTDKVEEFLKLINE